MVCRHARQRTSGLEEKWCGGFCLAVQRCQRNLGCVNVNAETSAEQAFAKEGGALLAARWPTTNSGAALRRYVLPLTLGPCPIDRAPGSCKTRPGSSGHVWFSAVLSASMIRTPGVKMTTYGWERRLRQRPRSFDRVRHSACTKTLVLQKSLRASVLSKDVYLSSPNAEQKKASPLGSGRTGASLSGLHDGRLGNISLSQRPSLMAIRILLRTSQKVTLSFLCVLHVLFH